MLFYDRELEIDILREIEENSHHFAQLFNIMLNIRRSLLKICENESENL